MNIDYIYILDVKNFIFQAIHENCNISNLEGYDHDEFSDKITLCNDMMKDAIGNNDRFMFKHK